MTVEMKIEGAKAIFLLEHCAERCDGYQKDDACENCEINAAIKALDKQIPKKPKEYEDKFYACPNCENILLIKRNKYNTELMDKKNGLPYCLGCGQRILWEVEE